MDEILNKIIEIDKNSKQIVEFELEKKQKLDEYIETEYKIKKVVLDVEFRDEIDLEKQKRNEELFKYKKVKQKETDEKINQLKNNFEANRQSLIEGIINSIKQEED